MLSLPLRKISLSQIGGPADDRITLRLRPGILRGVRKRRILDDETSLRSIERDELAAFVVQVAAQCHLELRIVVHCLDQVREFSPVLKRYSPPLDCARLAT